MGIYALIPVQEAFHIDDVPDLQLLDCLIYVCRIVAQIGLYGKGIGLSIQRYIKIQIISILTGTIPVLQERNFVAIGVLAGLNCHSLEGYKLILVIDQLILTQKRCYIRYRSNIIAILQLKGCIGDLDFTGPLRLISRYLNLGTRCKLGVIRLGTSHII